MQAFGSETLLKGAMQHGDIAVAHYPLGMLQKMAKADHVHHPNGSIAAAGTKDGADAGVVEHPLEIFSPLVIGSGKRIPAAEKVLPENNMKTP
jgi:hypothetical protein